MSGLIQYETRIESVQDEYRAELRNWRLIAGDFLLLRSAGASWLSI